VKPITTRGLDLPSRYFQIHGADAEGNVIINRKLSPARGVAALLREDAPPCPPPHPPPCRHQACGSAATTGRGEIAAFGARVPHDAASLLKPFVSGVDDAADAGLISRGSDAQVDALRAAQLAEKQLRRWLLKTK